MNGLRTHHWTKSARRVVSRRRVTHTGAGSTRRGPESQVGGRCPVLLALIRAWFASLVASGPPFAIKNGAGKSPEGAEMATEDPSNAGTAYPGRE